MLKLTLGFCARDNAVMCREVGYIPTNYVQLCSSGGLDQYE